MMDWDFMIHTLNNPLEVYNVMLDGLENHQMIAGLDALTVI